jgi:uncharacterized protein YbjQ (UPF0145 family)
MAVVCARCGSKQGILATLSVDLSSGVYHCPKCVDAMASEKIKDQEVEKQRVERLMQLSRKVVVTTTPNIDGYKVKKYLGIESVEFVIGTGAFSEISSSIADFFGARSSAFEKKLRAAKQHAMETLKFLAAEKGANAVVGIDLDYTEFTGNRIALIINGTLVLAEPIAADA